MPTPKGAACSLSWREVERGQQNEGCGLGELSFIGLIWVFKACNSSHPHEEVLSSMVRDVEACCHVSVSPGESVREWPPTPAAFAEHKVGNP